MRPAWGLDGAVGAAFFLWVGGALAMVHGVSRLSVWILMLLGLVSLALVEVPPGPAQLAKRRLPSLTFVLAAGAVLVLALLHYAAAVSNAAFNPWDDNMAYRQFAEKLIETGSLYEPFSSRRLASMGGQTMLDVTVLAAAPGHRLHLLDTGICSLLTVGLLLGYGAVPGGRAAGLLAAILFITTANPGHNIGSEFSGVLFFLALFCFFDRRTPSDDCGWGHPILVGLVAAGVCTLRQSYLPTAAFTVIVNCVMRFLTEPPATRRRVLEETGRIALVTFVALLPWMITSVINARTFLFPLMTGNSNPDWGLLGTVSGWEEDRWFLINDFYFEPVRSIPMFLIAGCLLPATRRNIAARAQLIAGLIGFAMLVHSLRASVYYDSVERYYFAFLVAFACAVTLRATSVRGSATPRTWIPAALIVCGIGVHIVVNREDLQRLYTDWVNGAEALRVTKNADRKRPADLPPEFLHPPAGRRARRRADDGPRRLPVPARFSSKQNRQLRSARRGQPAAARAVFRGARKVRHLLAGAGVPVPGVRDRAVVSGSYPISRPRLAEAVKPGWRGGMYKAQARYYLDAFDSLMALTQSKKVLFHEGDYWVLDLSARP